MTLPSDAADLVFAQSPVGKVRWQLRPDETLALALRRILVEEIIVARAGLADAGLTREEAVHRTRRGLKRIRALFLVVETVPGADRDKRMRRARDAARLLAGARDADVMAAEARRLRLRAEGRAAHAAALLVERFDDRARRAHLETPPFDQVAARLRAIEAAARSLPTCFEAGRLLAEALTAAYRAGRRDWRDIDDGASVRALHEWRKRVKLRRSLSVLVPIPTPVTGRSIQTDLETLGEILGEEHDLAVMKHRLEEEPALLTPTEGREALFDLIAHRRRRLARTALDLGSELYDLRTRAFAAELDGLRELC